MIPIQVNEHTIGIILKELVRRAMSLIRNERFAFEATQKEDYYGSMDDVFTTADTGAQEIFAKSLQETFPGVGLIGEEGLDIPCTISGHDIYFTIDPLDGTKAFVRRQSHGVATMVALVMDSEVISAWIGDVNTLEIYGYRPRTEKVHRISQFETSQELNKIQRDLPLKDQAILLRSIPKTGLGAELIWRTIGTFRIPLVEGSSIGTWFTRLWKGECGALVLDPAAETPWDSTPVVGISKKLGFVFLCPEGRRWKEYEPELPKKVFYRPYPTMVVHRSLAPQFCF